MRSPRQLLRFILARFDRRALDRDMDDEMRLHIELHTEEGRDARTLAWLHDLVADLRYGVRTLRRAPLFTIMSVLSLGLGIGANIAVFSLLYGILMQPLAIPRPRELTALVLNVKGELYTSVLHRTYLALRDAPGAPRLEAVHEADDVLTEVPAIREYSRVDFVEGGFFSLLGVAPTLGRYVDPADQAHRLPVVVISDNLWTRYFGRGPDVLGKSLLLRGLAAALASTCALLALVLAMVGLGGLVGFSVARRTREIGVRMALGAQRASVIWLVLRGALAMALGGVLIGGPLALGAGQALRSLLYGIAPTSVLVLGAAAAALVGVAMLASTAPAWRAARVDPVIALRSD